MNIGITSQSQIKYDSLKKAFERLEITGNKIIKYDADSKIGEQPEGDETVIGARNRINDVLERNESLDAIISVESGIFLEQGFWIDRAVGVLYDIRKDEEYIMRSKGVMFPTSYVDRAREIGFETTTVGQVMKEEYFVKSSKDPHMSLAGIPRKKFIEDMCYNLLSKSNMFK